MKYQVYDLQSVSMIFHQKSNWVSQRRCDLCKFTVPLLVWAINKKRDADLQDDNVDLVKPVIFFTNTEW